MIKQLRITVLADDTVGRRGLLGEHGFALWIEADDTNILFDTGQGLVLTANAGAMGIDLGRTDAVVLSHGHYDHTGGLDRVMKLVDGVKVFAHPKAFEPKFARDAQDAVTEVGAPFRHLAQVESRGADVVRTVEATRVVDDVWASGEITRRNGFEDAGGAFFLDEACTQPDPMLDDQALYIHTTAGLVVVTGCGHSGLVNTLYHANEVTEVRRTYALLGGLHLPEKADERIERTVQALHRFDVFNVAPAHCTGLAAKSRILQEFPDRSVNLTTGVQLTLV